MIYNLKINTVSLLYIFFPVGKKGIKKEKIILLELMEWNFNLVEQQILAKFLVLSFHYHLIKSIR